MDYYEKIQKEKEWHTTPRFNKKHFLNCFLFYSSKRNDFNYIFPRKNFFNYIEKTIISEKIKNPKILIAPIGVEDIKYIKSIKQMSYGVSGIDISQKVIDEIIDKDINKYCGDIKDMHMFDDNSFDLVISPLFFHHFVDFGFEDFLKEMHRVLKKDGYFFALEPSSFYPITWISGFVKKYLVILLVPLMTRELSLHFNL
jgi:SAM-dependent methyltransferase